jgi:hypothetical protein
MEVRKEVAKNPFTIEKLEERIAPSVHGTGGYDGQPGNQCNAGQNPSGSANPEGSANP